MCYWQIVESKRVNGKPRSVVAHLGTAEKLLYRLTQGPVQKGIHPYSHRAEKLLWKAAQKLELYSLFSTVFSSQMRNDISVGTTLLMNSIHRALQQGSKRSFSSWPEHSHCYGYRRITQQLVQCHHENAFRLKQIYTLVHRYQLMPPPATQSLENHSGGQARCL